MAKICAVRLGCIAHLRLEAVHRPNLPAATIPKLAWFVRAL